MTKKNIKFIRGIGMMIGSIVGVGVFGLPYAFAQSGFSVGLAVLLFMAVLLTTLQLMYAEVVIQTPGKHRLVGFVRMYMGHRWSGLALVTLAASMWGAMLAYIIIGGNFFHLLFGQTLGVPEFVCSLIMAGLVSYFIYRGLQFASKAEVFMILLLLLLFVFIIIAATPHVNPRNLITTDWTQMMVPYGVVLFAMAGAAVVPELKEVIGRENRNRFGLVIMIGMVVIALLYGTFSFAVVGVTGGATTDIAFDGLIPVLGAFFKTIVALLGSLTILSIYMLIGVELQNMFRYDFKMKKPVAWALTALVPIGLFLAGMREFIALVGFVGAVFGGIHGILIVRVYEKMRDKLERKHHKVFHVPTIISLLIIGIFAIGVVIEIVNRVS